MSHMIRHAPTKAVLRAVGLTLLVMALVSGLGVGHSYAQQTGTLSSIGDGEITLLSSGWTTLQADEQAVYTFEYTGNGEVVSVWMNLAVPDSATFEIWEADAIRTDVAPIGTGTALPEVNGFVTWQGTFETAGSYAVLVTAADTPAQYLVNVGGPGVALPPPPPENTALTLPTLLNVREGPSTSYAVITTVEQGTTLTVLGRNALNTWILVELPDGTQGWVTRSLTNYTGVAELVEVEPFPSPTPDPNAPPTATPDPNITPAPDETLIPGNDEPLNQPEAGESLSGNWRLLEAGQRDWYTFQHTGGDATVHIWMDVQPANGADFHIFDQETAQAVMAENGQPLQYDAVGRGTPNPAEPGYLFWRGTFEEAGQFYVLVSHEQEGNVRYSIYAAGPGLARSMP